VDAEVGEVVELNDEVSLMVLVEALELIQEKKNIYTLSKIICDEKLYFLFICNSIAV
jgi:hypothetical protein